MQWQFGDLVGTQSPPTSELAVETLDPTLCESVDSCLPMPSNLHYRVFTNQYVVVTCALKTTRC